MKKSIVLWCMIFSMNCYGQICGWLLDSEENPVKNASVILIDSLKKGTTTKENGYFSIVGSFKSYIFISAVGFHDTIIPGTIFSAPNVRIKLRTQVYKLDEVVVSANRLQLIKIGNPEAFPIFNNGWQREMPGELTGIYYKPKKKEWDRDIISVKINISKKGCYNTPMGFRMLSYHSPQIKVNKKLSRNQLSDLLPELLVFQAEKPGWIDIDLTQYHIKMPEGGILVLVTALDAGKKFYWKDSNGKDYYGALVANSLKKYFPYKVVFSTPALNTESYYTVDNPLLRCSIPMFVLELK